MSKPLFVEPHRITFDSGEIKGPNDRDGMRVLAVTVQQFDDEGNPKEPLEFAMNEEVAAYFNKVTGHFLGNV